MNFVMNEKEINFDRYWKRCPETRLQSVNTDQDEIIDHVENIPSCIEARQAEQRRLP